MPFRASAHDVRRIAVTVPTVVALLLGAWAVPARADDADVVDPTIAPPQNLSVSMQDCVDGTDLLLPSVGQIGATVTGPPRDDAAGTGPANVAATFELALAATPDEVLWRYTTGAQASGSWFGHSIAVMTESGHRYVWRVRVVTDEGTTGPWASCTFVTDFERPDPPTIEPVRDQPTLYPAVYEDGVESPGVGRSAAFRITSSPDTASFAVEGCGLSETVAAVDGAAVVPFVAGRSEHCRLMAHATDRAGQRSLVSPEYDVRVGLLTTTLTATVPARVTRGVPVVLRATLGGPYGRPSSGDATVTLSRLDGSPGGAAEYVHIAADGTVSLPLYSSSNAVAPDAGTYRVTITGPISSSTYAGSSWTSTLTVDRARPTIFFGATEAGRWDYDEIPASDHTVSGRVEEWQRLATGSVTLWEGSKKIASWTVSRDRGHTTADHTFPVHALARGTHVLTLRYAGDADTLPGSATTTVQVFPLPMTAPVPKVAGRARVGATLIAYRGTWTPSPSAVRYQRRINGVPVHGANGSRFVVPASALGRRVSVSVTGSRSRYLTRTTTSLQTAPVTR
ncbi:Ig-like domain-containing protein [Luteimicrobium subarcticum]|uniref:Ig-like domain-containing protein n=1 Tax=Luteimicrobium subarcticum TaxID=620910 RepID=A0A2M8WTB7_9MICO|nr:Ig-like domain-containing protein [Luteimicrobium subarcticum]PJI94190.1 Ig-like domain-containing protein [Luteimicrobium subarcticum]